MTRLPGTPDKPSPWACENCGPVQSEDVDDNCCCVFCGGDCEYTNSRRFAVSGRMVRSDTRSTRDRISVTFADAARDGE